MTLTELFAQFTEGVHDPDIFKALIVIGGPGSGKTAVSKLLTSGTGLKRVDVDAFYEMIKTRKGSKEFELPTDIESDPDWIRSREAKTTQHRNLLDGRLGLVLDVTGRWAPSVINDVRQLRELGYDVTIVYVKSNLDIAIKRQQQRPRRIKPEIVTRFHQDVESNLGQYQQLVGDNFVVIDNSGDSLNQAVENPKQFQSSYPRPISAERWIRQWLKRPVKNPRADRWRREERGH